MKFLMSSPEIVHSRNQEMRQVRAGVEGIRDALPRRSAGNGIRGNSVISFCDPQGSA